MGSIVITGSQSGMGWVVRQFLESQGHAIIGVDLPGKGAEVDADLSTAEGRSAAVAAVLERCDGRLHGVFANAGVDIDDPRMALAVNFFGVVEVLEGLQPRLAAAAPSAAVVNISDSISITPRIPDAPVEALLAGEREQAIDLLQKQPKFSYQVSKFALARWLRRQAATEAWAGSGIRLNGVCPGPVMTPLLERDLQDPVKGPLIEALPRPLGDFTSPEQVAYLVEFLLSERARFLVGQLIMIDGGVETALRADDHPSVWQLEGSGET